MTDQKDSSTAKTSGTPGPKRGRGRPRKFDNPAEKQKAYREKLKADGKRVVSRVVRDVREDVPLQSDIIDLSEVRHLSRRWLPV